MPRAPRRRATLYGKYRGIVADNADPEGRGRLRLLVPDVLGAEHSAWAEACLPPMGGLAPVLPAIGARIWVEFERGDPTLPIWSGCAWSEFGGAPALSITVAADGITLANGQGASIRFAGPVVSVNGGALEVI